MGQAIAVRSDNTAGEVRRFAKQARDGAQARRLLAIAAVPDGASRAEAAAKIGGMDRQTLRDWVIRFNDQGRDISSNIVRGEKAADLPVVSSRPRAPHRPGSQQQEDPQQHPGCHCTRERSHECVEANPRDYQRHGGTDVAKRPTKIRDKIQRTLETPLQPK
jgi:transposase-like protein